MNIRGPIDTHTHSAVSDGTQRPTELLNQALHTGLGMIGLTDHDTVGGWPEAEVAAAQLGLGLLRGMEVTTRYEGASVHMLAYLFNPEHPIVARHVERTARARSERVEEMVALLARDYPISIEDVRAQAAGDSIGRPHIADALVAAGIVESRSEAFEHLLSSSGPYYVPHRAPDALAAIEWICAAGGKAVVAHPLASGRGKALSVTGLAAFAEAGMFGVEVWHRDNPPGQRDALAARAGELGLACFGSSDYHGSGKPNELGEHTTPLHVVQALADGAYLPLLLP